MTQVFGILKCRNVYLNSYVTQYKIKGGDNLKKKLLGAIFASILVLGACGGGGNTTNDDGGEDTSGDVASVDAEKIVNNKCITCHGGNLEGAGNAPALANVGSDLSETEIHDVIINGQGGMPGNIIQGEEAEAVAKWLSEKK